AAMLGLDTGIGSDGPAGGCEASGGTRRLEISDPGPAGFSGTLGRTAPAVIGMSLRPRPSGRRSYQTLNERRPILTTSPRSSHAQRTLTSLTKVPSRECRSTTHSPVGFRIKHA